MSRTADAHPPTRERLLDAAEELMLAQGFTATTVDDICAAAKLTKGSFFHYFKTKDELARELLKRFCAKGQGAHQACCTGEQDPLKRVYAYIDGAAKMMADPSMRGCLLGSFAQELCDTDPKMRAACEEGFRGWASAFAAELARAKAAYPPAVAFDPVELANHFIAVMEGSMILGKAAGDMKSGAANLKHFRAYVKHLFGR